MHYVKFIYLFIYLFIYIGTYHYYIHSNYVLFSLLSPLEHIISAVQYYIMYIKCMTIIFFAISMLSL
jgi:hypothetical protein